MHFSARRGALLAALAVNGGLLALVGCAHGPATVAPPVVTPPPLSISSPAVFTDAHYVGNAACAECHQSQYLSQSHSRHAQTLLPMSQARLGRLAPPTGPVAGSGLVLLKHDDRFGMGAAAHPNFVLPLGYALGSGKTGMTYVSVVEGGQVAEMRVSYFPHRKRWYVTPGDEHLAAGALARVLPSDDIGTCFHCHAVMAPHTTLVPPSRFFGVGCESCHGPGSAHIAQMRAGRYAQDSMEHLEKWPAARLLALCGQCHGAAMTGSHTAAVTTSQTNRFQPLGLSQSQCYRRSQGALSCLTCHDSHTNVSTDENSYISVCLSCHTPVAAHRPPPLRNTLVKLCPVNPTGNCITCHMPSRKMIVNSQVPTLMADHFIRVNK